jgi:hypothetical protein
MISKSELIVLQCFNFKIKAMLDAPCSLGGINIPFILSI